jgi:opacity protein-like surface antigen
MTLIRKLVKTLGSPLALALGLAGSIALTPVAFAGGPEEVPADAQADTDTDQTAQAPDNDSQMNQKEQALDATPDSSDDSRKPIEGTDDQNQVTSNEQTTPATTTPAIAVKPAKKPVIHNVTGLYVRGQLGDDWADKQDTLFAHQDTTITTLGLNNKDSRGLMGRIAAGYQFNSFLGVEVGAALFHKLSEDYTTTTPTNKTGNIKTSLFAIDALIKGTYSFDKAYVFGGVGAAYVHAKSSSNFDLHNISSGQEYSFNTIRPKIAVGAGYNIKDNLSVDVEYSRIFGKGELGTISNKADTTIDSVNTKFLPAINTVAVGLTYKFNDMNLFHHNA